MRSRSNSAIAPRMCIWSLPAGVVASIPSVRLTKRDAEGLQLVEQRDQVPEVPAEPIQPPADQHVEPTPLGIPDQLIQRRPPVLAPAHPFVDVLDRRPAPGSDVPPQLGELILGLLVEGRDHERRSRPLIGSASARLAVCSRFRVATARPMAASRATASLALAWRGASEIRRETAGRLKGGGDLVEGRLDLAGRRPGHGCTSVAWPALRI